MAWGYRDGRVFADDMLGDLVRSATRRWSVVDSRGLIGCIIETTSVGTVVRRHGGDPQAVADAMGFPPVGDTGLTDDGRLLIMAAIDVAGSRTPTIADLIAAARTTPCAARSVLSTAELPWEEIEADLRKLEPGVT